MKYTAIVVTHNDARRLHDCLNSLSFCDQIIIIDLHSTDNTLEIAKLYSIEIRTHEKVPVVEMLWPEAVKLSLNDWIILIDPDEVFPQSVLPALEQRKIENTDIGIIQLPWQFYFKEKKLETTIWGGTQKVKKVILNKHRVEFTGVVHRGVKLRKGYSTLTIQAKTDEDFIKHYWMDSYKQLFSKHVRYINQEGKRKYEAGERFSLIKMVTEIFRFFYLNLIRHCGWRGGITGIFLSFFYSWYIFMSWLALKDYQKLLRQ